MSTKDKVDTLLQVITDFYDKIKALIASQRISAVKEDVTIPSGAVEEYDLEVILGAQATLYDLEHPIITVLVKDAQEPSEEIFVNSEGVAAVALVDGRYIRITNHHTTDLTFRVRVDVDKLPV